MQVQLFSVLVDKHRISASVFKQLECVPLWTVEEGKDTSLELLGVVRCELKNGHLWVLAIRGERLVRCALNPRRIPDEEYEREINRLKDLLTPEHRHQTTEALWEGVLMRKVKERPLEEDRYETHLHAANMTQLFLSLR